MRRLSRLLAGVLLLASTLAADRPSVGRGNTPEVLRAAARITEEVIRAHTKFLASDLLEGRGPATRGDSLAETYIQSQMEAMGVKPGAPGGGWIQKVPLVGVKASFSAPAVFRSGRGSAEGVPGDPMLSSEAVVYTAHHDHFGIKAGPRPEDDAIYNGAIDNASGVASILSVARAFADLRRPPRRSVYFAFVAGEEQGLLGSQYFAMHPPVPVGRIAANINIDEANWFGKTRDISLIGLGKSSLDRDVIAVAKTQGRAVKPDEFPDRGRFYRSDQFNFAKAGVPAAYLKFGTDVIGKPAGYGKEQVEAYEKNTYHQPSDEYRDGLDFSGAVQDARLAFLLGRRVANADAMPVWTKGDEFEAARKKAVDAIKPR